MLRRLTQSGRFPFTALGYFSFELILVLSVVAIFAGVQIRKELRYAEQLTNTQVADYQRQVAKAAKTYILKNSATILATTSATTALPITVATLKAANLLTVGFGAVNSANQTPCVIVLQPTAGNLNAVLTTEGQPLPLRRLNDIAGQLAGEGGYVDPKSVIPFAKSNAKTFNFDLTPYRSVSCSGTPVTQGGLSARLSFADIAIPPPFIYRDPVPGNPNASTMNNTLNMGGNPITNVSTIALSGNVTAPCFVSPTNPADLVCPSGNSNINTLTAQQITTKRMTDLDDPTKFIDPSGTSVLKDVFITDRTVGISVKSLLPNVVTYDGYDINMATSGGPQIVPFPPCQGVNKELIHVSIKKAQMTLNGVSVTHHVDATAGGAGWTVGIYDSLGVPQASGIVSVVLSCNYKGV